MVGKFPTDDQLRMMRELKDPDVYIDLGPDGYQRFRFRMRRGGYTLRFLHMRAVESLVKHGLLEPDGPGRMRLRHAHSD